MHFRHSSARADYTESEVSGQEAAPAAITIRNRSSRPGGRRAAATRRGRDLPKGYKKFAMSCLKTSIYKGEVVHKILALKDLPMMNPRNRCTVNGAVEM